ncbi:serologically defined colon cancer antigen 8 homolog isoform X2 [Leptinotarsa decemlineata]
MEWRRKPDYADTAYREAVGRLRILLAESYGPIKRPLKELDSAGEETDNQSVVSAASRNSKVTRSYYHYNSVNPRKYYHYPTSRSNYNGLSTETEKPYSEPPKLENQSHPPELMNFIERQDEYIEQLEKESKICREELSSVLVKVKELIKENEHLHDRQVSRKIKSVFENLDTETDTETDIENKSILKSPKKTRKNLLFEGPAIVFESRISELEAQLTQARIDLKKALEENETNRRKLNDGTILESAGFESYKKQLENLQREKQTLQDTVQKLQNSLALLRDKENDTSDKVKRSLDVAEQAQYEKNAAESEIRRLKDELERQHMKMRDAIADQGRRIADERSAVERRYSQQIEQLTTELGVQWESSNKLQLELDKQRRENADLRREVAQKQALIDELKKEMQNKIITLQSDIGASGAEKGALEQQIAMLQMANERSERQSKQEVVRLQAEIQSLRQRIDRADADLIHSRRENIRLSEQVASLEKEINLSTALSEERSKTPRGSEIVALPPPTPKKEDKEKELTSMVYDMENRHDEEHTPTSRQRHESPGSTTFSSKPNISSIQTAKPSQPVNADTMKSQPMKNVTTTRYAEPEQKTLSRKNSNVSDKLRTPLRENSREQLQSVTSPAHLETQKEEINTTNQTSVQNPSGVQPNQSGFLPAQEHNIETDEYPQYDATDHYNPEQNYDSVQQYDPNQGYDPNQQYDPTQQYNQPYDHNQEYDPNQEYDTSQQYDPNLHYDPNKQYDSSLHYDSNDTNQPYQVDSDNIQQYHEDGTDPNQRPPADLEPSTESVKNN